LQEASLWKTKVSALTPFQLPLFAPQPLTIAGQQLVVLPPIDF
jgi:hypothetical protein